MKLLKYFVSFPLLHLDEIVITGTESLGNQFLFHISLFIFPFLLSSLIVSVYLSFQIVFIIAFPRILLAISIKQNINGWVPGSRSRITLWFDRQQLIERRFIKRWTCGYSSSLVQVKRMIAINNPLQILITDCCRFHWAMNSILISQIVRPFWKFKFVFTVNPERMKRKNGLKQKLLDLFFKRTQKTI